MSETLRLQGRPFGPAELGQVRELLAEHPDWSRSRRSRSLATRWSWHNPAGQLKDTGRPVAARTLLITP